jgi:Ca2+-transporting ATPase
VLLINALVGFATEFEAGRALEALRRQTKTTARVRRDGRENTVDDEELVPGDVVLLTAGDRVPADARILEAVQLRAEESALTGESTTVEKSELPAAANASLAERSSMIYFGTAIAAGHCIAVVVDTAMNTELGRIGKLVAASTKERSPLENRLAALGRRLVYVVLAIALVVVFAGWLRGDELWMMVEIGISLAVAAVPEGLPAVTTLILALGVLRMAKQRAIVRRLPAVETLGSATVICTDKTGTLTENRMTVREYFLSDGRTVEIAEDNGSRVKDDLLEHAVRIGVLCSEASFQVDEAEQLQAIGDPTETALLVVADALVLDVHRERLAYPKSAEQPFHPSAKRMTTVHEARGGGHFAALKGAPGVVLEACSSYCLDGAISHPMDKETRAKFHAVNEEMAGRALRVLALAVKHFDEAFGHPSDTDLQTGFTFLAFVGMIDPPRPGVAEAIQSARTAGIRTVMLTGDQVNTGKAIARELGIGDESLQAVQARDLTGIDQSQLAQLARSTEVFARVSPEDKLRIVEALQEAGEVVAVTGDGVNDAPALKRANIGIAMGQRGTEVAKDASDVVLADDNFATIVGAIEGGRTIYANIIKFVHMMFSHNLAEVIVIFVAIVIGWPLPLLPLQILWMNLVTDVFPALGLAVEPPSSDIMKRPPHSRSESFLSRRFVLLIAWQAAMLGAIGLLAYAWALSRYGPGSHARSIALFSLIAIQLGHVFNCRSQTRSAFAGLTRNPFIWVAVAIVVGLQFLAVYLAPLRIVLDTVEPMSIDWIVIGTGVLLPVAIVEVTKLVRRWRSTVREH